MKINFETGLFRFNAGFPSRKKVYTNRSGENKIALLVRASGLYNRTASLGLSRYFRCKNKRFVSKHSVEFSFRRSPVVVVVGTVERRAKGTRLAPKNGNDPETDSQTETRIDHILRPFVFTLFAVFATMSRRLDTLFMRRIIRRPTTNRLRKRTFLYAFAALLSDELGHTRDYGRTTEKIEKPKNIESYPTYMSSPP